MTSSSEASEMFARACMIRDEGRLDEAIDAFEEIVNRFPQDEAVLRHSYGQLGYIHDLLDHREQSEASFREAVRHGPQVEVLSLGLFHALLARGKVTSALQEAIRFLGERGSHEYRDMFAGSEFRDELADGDRELAARVRSLLQLPSSQG